MSLEGKVVEDLLKRVQALEESSGNNVVPETMLNDLILTVMGVTALASVLEQKGVISKDDMDKAMAKQRDALNEQFGNKTSDEKPQTDKGTGKSSVDIQKDTDKAT